MVECGICIIDVNLRNFQRCINCDNPICNNCLEKISDIYCPFCRTIFRINSNNNLREECEIDGCIGFIFWRLIWNFKSPLRERLWVKCKFLFLCCIPIGFQGEFVVD